MAAKAVESAAVTALRSVLHHVRHAAEGSSRHVDDVRVVAVNKTKPISLICHDYDAGHRCFGEFHRRKGEEAPDVDDGNGVVSRRDVPLRHRFTSRFRFL